MLADIGEKHHKSAAQVNLRFLVQSGICAIPKTVHPKRMEENLAVFDFELTVEEMRQIGGLDTGKSLFIDFCAPEVAEMFASAGKL